MVMNLIEVTGGKKDKKELAEKVVSWYLKKMMPRYKTLDITIKLTNCYDNGAYGYCMQTEDNRTFELEIDKNLRLFDFVSTICHEMTHLKQYARKEMVQLDDGRTRWKKKVYPEGFDYDKSPWEKEAFRVETELAMLCFHQVL
jgi:hypothetical protein